MQRRSLLALMGSLTATTLAGCTGQSDGSDGTTTRSPDETDTPNTDIRSTRQRIVRCERQYVRTELVSDDEQVMAPLEPEVLDHGTADDGVYLTVRTVFGTRKSTEGAPDLTMDHRVTAYYYHGSNGTYRTDDPDQNPTKGTRIQCE